MYSGINKLLSSWKFPLFGQFINHLAVRFSVRHISYFGRISPLGHIPHFSCKYHKSCHKSVEGQERDEIVGGHTKPLEACGCHVRMQKYHLSFMEIWGWISPTKMCPMTTNYILRQTACSYIYIFFQICIYEKCIGRFSNNFKLQKFTKF